MHQHWVADHVSFLDIRNVIPTQLIIVVFNLNFIALDMDNSEVYLVFRHETPTCVVSYQCKVSNINAWLFGSFEEIPLLEASPISENLFFAISARILWKCVHFTENARIFFSFA